MIKRFIVRLLEIESKLLGNSTITDESLLSSSLESVSNERRQRSEFILSIINLPTSKHLLSPPASLPLLINIAALNLISISILRVKFASQRLFLPFTSFRKFPFFVSEGWK